MGEKTVESEVSEKKWKLPKLSVGKIILISIILSGCINGIYGIIETICVKTGGELPIKRVLYGGDCIEHFGMYWGITILTPMTTMDQPHVSEPHIQYFSWLRFGGWSLLLALGLFILLLLLNRQFKTLIITVAVVGGIVLLINGAKRIKQSWEDAPVELISVTVITADLHPGVYNSISYPKYASKLVLPGDGKAYGHSENESMQGHADPNGISRKQLRALIRAAKEIRENTNTDRNKDFAYRIKIVYKTNGGYKNLQTIGYESFPEQWGDFIRILNQTCDISYLRDNPEMVRFSMDWFCDTYGITDRDMPEGASVEQFLKQYQITMQNLCGMNSHSWDYQCFQLEKFLKEYVTSFPAKN